MEGPVNVILEVVLSVNIPLSRPSSVLTVVVIGVTGVKALLLVGSVLLSNV